MFFGLLSLLLVDAAQGFGGGAAQGFAEGLSRGEVVVVEDWMPSKSVARLRADAVRLYEEGNYNPPDRDLLLRQGPRYDRSVLRESRFSDSALGDGEARGSFGKELARVRAELARDLDRPTLAVNSPHRHEASYTRFGPGASLRRHIDEHHEELKGRDGWTAKTRRSISWLVYLNDKWDADDFGGQLRAYVRRLAPRGRVGAHRGDLQVGWLDATPRDPVERPVFLDARVRDRGAFGNCRLYVANDGENAIISRTFFASPVMFLKGNALQDLVITNNLDAKRRYRPLEVVTSSPAVQELERLIFRGGSAIRGDDADDVTSRVLDIPPKAGTLVLFDSVTVPHEVLETRLRPRFACSGWFHEDQQEHLI
mmetsp:Transcript_79/g.278  ORF Transcript_79/g.278 Transcript_79/m.278 type:complete len:368 (-) Transcript_79:27-1130(-)